MKVSIFVFVFALLASIAFAKDVGQSCSQDKDCGDDRLECVMGSTERSVWLRDDQGPDPGEPTTAEPETGEPTTGEPATPEPTTGEPATPEPTTAEPNTREPTTAEPNTREPTTAEPNTAEPNTAEPNTGSTPADQGTCQCKNEFELTNDKKKCRMPITAENEYECEEDYDCEVIGPMPVRGYEKPGDDPQCKDKTCQCGTKDEEEEWFIAEYLDNFVCIHQIQNFTCNVNIECSWLESEKGNTTANCTDNICACFDEDDSVAFWPSDEDPQKCERVLGGSCRNDDQCSHIEDAHCSDDGECSCDRNYKADSDNELFACKKKDSGASTVVSSILLLISSVCLGRWNS